MKRAFKPIPKLELSRNPFVSKDQRGGWVYACESLRPLFGESGVHFEHHVEGHFSRYLGEAPRERIAPILRPWIGVVHNPPGMPRWHDYRRSPRSYFRLKAWRDSLPYCRGLIALSRWMADWVRQRVGVPTLALAHPTPIPEVTFSMERFRANGRARVIQVGWWLRRLSSIHDLPLHQSRKAMLVPASRDVVRKRFWSMIERECAALGAPPVDRWDASVIPYQSVESNDRLVSENVVFLHLIDRVANNTIIECIVRGTPVLVNPLPSVVEHLGVDYPLYFRSLEEAAEKASDMALIERAHLYLRGLPKERFDGGYFCRSLADSDLYRGL